jgi:hypothetical protein
MELKSPSCSEQTDTGHSPEPAESGPDPHNLLPLRSIFILASRLCPSTSSLFPSGFLGNNYCSKLLKLMDKNMISTQSNKLLKLLHYPEYSQTIWITDQATWYAYWNYYMLTAADWHYAKILFKAA